MEFSKVIAARHSVRQFQDKAVDREIVDAILDQTQTAPSSKNSRSSAFVVVDDKDMLEALSEMRTYGSALLKGAACAVVVLGDTTKTDLWIENAAISATYIQLCATNLGLGSCWVHVNGRLRDHKDPSKGLAEDYVRDLLGLKEAFKPLCIVALGYEA
jgi:nitroreductase